MARAMNSIACYTAVAGAYDPIPPHPDIAGVDFLAFVEADGQAEANKAGWIPMPFHPSDLDAHPRMRAKRPKLLPHVMLPNYEVTIWIDASHEIKNRYFVEQMTRALAAGDAGFVLHRHPWRDCIYTEAVASLELAKYQDTGIEDQIAAYRRAGHPEHWGLWACGSMARVNGDRINSAMEAWFAECQTWSYQDQLSLPVVMRNAGWRPDVFDFHQVTGNPWFNIRTHPRNDE